MSDEQKQWQQRLEELEKEVNDTFETTPIRLKNASQTLETTVNRFRLWYQGLSTPIKAIVVIGGILVIFSLLNMVLKLVASLISLGILAIIFYGLYKFVISPQKSDQA